MSALPPKADMCGATRDVRFGPIADIPRMSLNHNVCSREQRRRDCEPKRFGSFQIHDQFIFCRSLHRKVGWPLTLEDPIDIAGRAPELVGEIRPIRDQATISNEESIKVDRG
jgi:hypothetical protein